MHVKALNKFHNSDSKMVSSTKKLNIVVLEPFFLFLPTVGPCSPPHHIDILSSWSSLEMRMHGGRSLAKQFNELDRLMLYWGLQLDFIF